jgi:hypothetical protein
MPDPETMLAKEEIYKSLALINASLKTTVEHLEKLIAAEAAPENLGAITCALLRCKQSEISQQVTSRMNTCELNDSASLEKKWLALEEKLKEMDRQAEAEAEARTELKRKVGTKNPGTMRGEGLELTTIVPRMRPGPRLHRERGTRLSQD